MVVRLVALLSVVLLAGCAGQAPGPGSGEEPVERADVSWWVPDPCDPRGEEGLSGNMPNVTGLRGTEMEVAANVAEAFDDRLVGGEPWIPDFGDETSMARYNTTGGRIQVQRFTDGPSTYAYETFHGGFLTRQIVEEALERLGAHGLRHDGHDEGVGTGAIRQSWDGRELDRTGVDWSTGQGDPAEDGWWGSATIHGLHVLPGSVDEQSAKDLREWSGQFARCVLARNNATEDHGYKVIGMEDAGGPAVMHQSLMRRYGLTLDDPNPDSHCDTTGLFMEVDAETGAVAAWYPYGCM